jgi:hypothetical protein
MPSARALWSLMLAMTPVAIAEFDQCARPRWRVGRLYDQVTTTAHDPCVRLHNSARLTCDGRARRVLGVPEATRLRTTVETSSWLDMRAPRPFLMPPDHERAAAAWHAKLLLAVR